MREKPFAVQAASSPSALSENSGGAVGGDGDRVGREALLRHAAVGLVAEAEVDLLARVGVQRVTQLLVRVRACRSAPACRCASRGIGLAVRRAVDRRPVGAAVRRHLGVEVVVVGLDVPPAVEGSGDALDLPVRSTERVRVFLRSSPMPLHHCLEPSAGFTIVGGDRLLRQLDDEGLRVLGVVLGDTQLVAWTSSPALRLGVVEPAELELVPGVHVAGQVADGVLAGAEPGAGRHQGPEAGGVLAAAGGVVLVGQAEVVAVLVGEDAEAAVLRLHGVVADPDAGVADLGAAELVVRRAGAAGVGAVRVPAVGPDGVRRPAAPPPADSSSPACTIWKWSM